jgi:cholesterol oxidase
MADFKTVVIGSGFGGAVAACRLSARGKLLVLERGRRWDSKDYPVKPESWLWKEEDPARHHGWFDFRSFGKHMGTVAGAGVGGGSLHYANVSIPAPPDAFGPGSGWPAEITHGEMAQYYDRVTQMLTPGGPGFKAPGGQAVSIEHTIPDNQEAPRTRLLREAATKNGFGARFSKVNVAVNFDPGRPYDASQSPDEAASRKIVNAQGVEQGTCAHLGYCVVGCPVRARNVLEYNYLAVAERNGADIRPLHIVRSIVPEGGAYRVHFERIDAGAGALRPGSATAEVVVVAAGSVGSTELLLRCRDQHGSLPQLGPMLGRRWCSNANYLSIARHKDVSVYPKRGPSITGAVGFFGAQKFEGQAVNIEDGGGPDFLRILLHFGESGGFVHDFLDSALDAVSADRLVKEFMPWFSQGRDESAGVFRLKDEQGAKVLDLDWDTDGADATVKAIIKLHKLFAEKTGGNLLPALNWNPLRKNLLTPHPLGGCVMGQTAGDGVVNHRGAVFGCPNLYVADAAVFPRAIGLNPSKTIAAMAERIAALMP